MRFARHAYGINFPVEILVIAWGGSLAGWLMPRRHAHCAPPMRPRKLLYYALLTGLSLTLIIVVKLNSGPRDLMPIAVTRALNLQTAQDEVIIERRRHLTEACQRMVSTEERHLVNGYQSLARNPAKLTHIIVDDIHRVLYCYVPKVACTNWKRVMLLLSGQFNFTRPEEIPADHVHRRDLFVSLNEFSPAEILYRLQTYKKFMFVRHPLERIISAFRNKFEMNYSSSIYFKTRFGVHILKTYREDKDEKTSSSGDGVKFHEFVQYVWDTGQKDVTYLNEHWAPYTFLCQPCAVRYNLIGKYESLDQDSKYILRDINAPSSIQFPPVVSSRTTKMVDKYVGELHHQHLEHFIELYKDDFNLFQYHYKNYI